MHDGTEHERWAHGGEIKVGLFLFDELPCCSFGEGFARSVACKGILEGLGVRERTPVGAAVRVA